MNSNCDKFRTLQFMTIASLKGVGYKTIYSIFESGVSFEEIFEMQKDPSLIDMLKNHGAKIPDEPHTQWLKAFNDASAKAHAIINAFSENNIQLIFRDHPDFPKPLLDCPQPPFWLFVKGSTSVLKTNSITIVGTRKPTKDGFFLADFVGASLGLWGFPTVSGLATGIDQKIHDWSIRIGLPTIAVLGTGILTDYPKGSEKLREQIESNGGATITEYLPYETYGAQNFVMRNRLQAGLGKCLIPVEWTTRSGTAHTVNFASRMGRCVACLRLPHWPSNTPDLSNYNEKDKMELFNVPGEESSFRAYVADCVGFIDSNEGSTFPLFREWEF